MTQSQYGGHFGQSLSEGELEIAPQVTPCCTTARSAWRNLLQGPRGKVGEADMGDKGGGGSWAINWILTAISPWFELVWRLEGGASHLSSARTRFRATWFDSQSVHGLATVCQAAQSASRNLEVPP